MAHAQPKQIMILDGGMSRELIRLNAPFRQPQWSALSLMEAPHLVRQIHLEFARAGADIITTNSYALVPFHIGEECFRERGRELAALAGKLAREAADEVSRDSGDGRKVLVAGSLPPVFGSYEPEKFQAEEVQGYLSVLVEEMAPHVDVWLGETLSLIAEAEAVKTATQGTGKPVWVSFCPDDSASASFIRPCLRSGESVSGVTRWAMKAGIEALLFNCSNPKHITSAVETASKELVAGGRSVLLGAYANAFVPRSDEYAANEHVSAVDESLDTFTYAEEARSWIDSGASIVGGCCGIGVSHIKQLAEAYKLS